MDAKSVSKSFLELKELDEVLRCGICHDTITTPVLTSCSHTFCSLCIRKWLATRQVCPSCQENVYESSLRRNTIVASVVEAVERLKRAKKGKESSDSLNLPPPVSPTVSKISPEVNIQTESKCVHHKNSRTYIIGSDEFIHNVSVQKVHTNRQVASTLLPPEIVQIDRNESSLQYQNDKLQDDFVPKPLPKQTTPQTSKENLAFITSSQSTSNKGTSPAVKNVSCPICSNQVPERVINEHLDKCLSGGSTRSSTSKNCEASNSVSSSTSCASVSEQRAASKSTSFNGTSNETLRPIKKMVYNLMSDALLKKELKKYGLATQGGRVILAGRLQRYVLMHNAECDSINPRSQEDLRIQFEKEERALVKTPNNKFSQLFKTKQPDPKEFDMARKEYIRQNNDSFQDLIQQVKNRHKNKSNQKKPIKPTTVLSSSEEDDPDPLLKPNGTNKESNLDLSSSDSASEHVHKTPLKGKGIPESVNGVIYNQSSDSDVAPGDASETPKTRKTVSRTKRKVQCIESESDEDSRPEKRVSKDGNSSPVLLSKTPVRRELRSQSSGTKSQPQKKLPPCKPPVRIRNQRKRKCELTEKGETKKAGPHKPDLPPVSGTTECGVETERSDSTDLFGSPPSPSSSGQEIPCGQRSLVVHEDSDNALSQLVSLMEDDGDNGSSTDFEN